MAVQQEPLPAAVQRADDRAREIWKLSYQSAVKLYGPGERAERTADKMLAQDYVLQGDHWVPREGRPPEKVQVHDPDAENTASQIEHYNSLEADGRTSDGLQPRNLPPTT
jgi:hypothetical protein